MGKAIAYTDGACAGNPGPGGWAAILRGEDGERVLQGGASLTTNNRMELRAAIAVLQALPQPHAVEVYTDSEYLRLGVTKWLANWVRNGWLTTRREPVKNQDLWRSLQAAMRPHVVEWHWVRGHSGNNMNERVDRLAVDSIGRYGSIGVPDLEPLAQAQRQARAQVTRKSE